MYYTILYYTILYYTILYYIELYYIILYYIILMQASSKMTGPLRLSGGMRTLPAVAGMAADEGCSKPGSPSTCPKVCRDHVARPAYALDPQMKDQGAATKISFSSKSAAMGFSTGGSKFRPELASRTLVSTHQGLMPPNVVSPVRGLNAVCSKLELS